MISIRTVYKNEKDVLKDVVSIHLNTFKGFFLTFMGKGFLYQMYKSYTQHSKSDILIAVENGKILGFLSYSSDMSGLYKYMIKHKLIPFAWYSLGAFFRKPKTFMHLIRAFLKPGEAKREEKYIELSSIGVDPAYKSKGIGTMLVSALKEKVDFKENKYITLETDAENNEIANHFYKKNGFELYRTYETVENRKMNEYHFGAKT